MGIISIAGNLAQAEKDSGAAYARLVLSEATIPLRQLEAADFPDKGDDQSGLSTSVWVWPSDLPRAGHKANSIRARAALLRYKVQSGFPSRVYSAIRERAFYALAGRAQFVLEERKYEADPGGMVFVPSNVRHSCQVVGGERLKMLLMKWRGELKPMPKVRKMTIGSEKAKPMRVLTLEEAGSHRGISASPFITSKDYPRFSHQANSHLAWISLQQYAPNPSQANTDVHSHAESEQAFFIISGKARFIIGDTEQDVGPGEFVYAPRHVKHGYRVPGEEPVKWFMMGWSSEWQISDQAPFAKRTVLGPSNAARPHRSLAAQAANTLQFKF